MAKISKASAVLQEAEFATTQTVVKVRSGLYEDREGKQQLWVHLECVDELLYANAEALGIDIEDLPTLTVKIKNPDSRNWEEMIGHPISLVSATVVPVISNNQLKGLALSIDASAI